MMLFFLYEGECYRKVLKNIVRALDATCKTKLLCLLDWVSAHTSEHITGRKKKKKKKKGGRERERKRGARVSLLRGMKLTWGNFGSAELAREKEQNKRRGGGGGGGRRRVKIYRGDSPARLCRVWEVAKESKTHQERRKKARSSAVPSPRRAPAVL